MFGMSSTLTIGVLFILLGAIFILVTFTGISGTVVIPQPGSSKGRKITGILGTGLLVLGLIISLVQTVYAFNLIALVSHSTVPTITPSASASPKTFATPSPQASATSTNTPVPVREKVAVPSYFDPGSLWTQMEGGTPTTGLAVINPDSGPGASKDSDYAGQVTHTEGKGLIVVGYVATSNASRSLAAVKQDIDKYYSWYPNINGIFIDEVNTDCSREGSYYQPLDTYIKSKGRNATVILDTGTDPPECDMSAGDIIVNFEDVYSQYINWTPKSWVFNYPASHFWQIVYSTTQPNMPQAITFSKNRNAGWVYVTDDGGDNPYDTLPSYWSSELSLVS